jgi:thiamine-phosphate pyrophosphorylase
MRLKKGNLPPLAMVCDDERMPNPLESAENLPPGTLVVIRSRSDAKRVALAVAMTKIARARGLYVSVAGDGVLATHLGLGLHLPEVRGGEIAHWRACRPGLFITVAAHSLRALGLASSFGADAAFLSPVFATLSHPGIGHLGTGRANCIARNAPLPVYALGGITAQNTSRISGFSGIAAIGALVIELQNANAGTPHPC